MKATFLILFVLGTVSIAYAQKSLGEIPAGPSAALERYITANKTLRFRHENNLSRAYLTEMRKSMGRSFLPNYATGDFNRDRVDDFAVLLNREGNSECAESIEKSDCDAYSRDQPEHYPDHPLRIVIFSGTGNNFRVDFEHDLMGPNAAFLSVSTRRGTTILYYGILETDSDIFTMMAAGKGYVIEYVESS